jgi:hypothetical protein
MAKAWVPYVVRKGDTVSRLAYRRRTTVKEVWGHPKNAELAALRKNPDVLCPADLLWLPPEDAPLAASVSPGGEVTVRAAIPTFTLRIALHDDDGKPLAGAAFEVDGGEVLPPGKTDGDGVAVFKTWVTTRSVVLRLPDRGLEFPVAIGGLDPAATRSGAVGRLRNLGLYFDEDRGPEAEDSYFRSVLFQFQEKHGLEETGELDEPTQAKLAELGGEDGAMPED